MNNHLNIIVNFANFPFWENYHFKEFISNFMKFSKILYFIEIYTNFLFYKYFYKIEFWYKFYRKCILSIIFKIDF